MRWIIMALLMVLAIMMVICYSLLVMASRADESARRMVRKWIEEHGDIVDNLTADTISADNITAKEMRDDSCEHRKG